MFNNSQLVQPFNNLHTVQNSINDNIENIIHEILNNTADINIKSIIDNSQQQNLFILKYLLINLIYLLYQLLMLKILGIYTFY